jgi:tRNA dimethylallyltransferase
VASLYSQLEQLDPQAAQRINPNDTQRLLRALEVYYLSGKPLSQAQEEAWRPGLINCQTLPLAILPEERKVLHERIDNRFVQMLEAGFISEVTNLRQRFPQLSATHNAMRSVGYRQVWEYLDGKCDYATLIATGQAASRQLAKRQITWLRSMPIIAMASSTLTSYELLPKIRAHIDSFLSGESV